MRVIILGNAGAGKSTLAQRLAATAAAARLSLDEVAFHGGTQRRAVRESVDAAKRWIALHDRWVIEGCYADLIEPLLDFCDELIFLNPGVAACVAHCRARPWEPEKFRSRQEQNAQLDFLIDWVRSYEERTDEYGLARHRALYDSYPGRKREITDPRDYQPVGPAE
ncbi:MAG: AAA family ATPase [Phycisphaeraceae bacterium]|nr:AAA family ATPase [Phycisphaeraceae bacterium]